MAQSGLALSTEQIIDILSMYSSSAEQVLAVAAAPGWEQIGGFPMPASADIRLDALGSVSSVSLAMSIRLYDTTVGFEGPVSGSDVQIASLTDVRQFSSVFPVVGGHQYQVHCQVIGAAGEAYFGSVARVAPAGA